MVMKLYKILLLFRYQSPQNIIYSPLTSFTMAFGLQQSGLSHFLSYHLLCSFLSEDYMGVFAQNGCMSSEYTVNIYP